MKKVLVVVALLLIATPVFAGTTVRLVPEGANFTVDGTKQQTVRVEYQTDVDIAAFALDINMNAVGNSSTFDSVRDYNVGESDARTKTGYGIFPSRFRDFITPLNGSQVDTGDGGWADPNYTPLTAWNEPGAQLTGIGFNTMVAELGTLYAGDGNKPALSGTLFRFDVNSEKYVGSFPLAVSADALRGGVVDKNAAGVTATFVGTTITFGGGNYTISGRVVGANAPKNTSGIEGVAMKGLPGEPNTDASGNFTATVPAGWSGTCTPTDQNNQWTWAPATLTYSNVSANMTGQNVTGTATECLNAKDPGYAAWKSTTWNKPNCWCNRRQCRGDVGGTKAGFWVYSSDLNTFKSAYGKADAVVATVPSGICADLDHVKSGFRTYSADLTIIKAYYGKADALVPECNLAPVIVKVNKWNN